jgi:2-(1,2-epoxy-1,2-dihydrophenyl)acetyl-CoA isomerase
MMKNYRYLNLGQTEGVLEVLLSRPKVNAFNLEMIDELIEVLSWSKKELTIRSIVISGEGAYFSTGQDIEVILELGDKIPYREHLRATYNRIVYLMRVIEKPILVAINGPVAGAALGLVLAADIRWASEAASFVFGFTRVGLGADAGTSYTLPMSIGWAKAMEMAFTNQPMSAEEALGSGLVSRVLPGEQLMPQIKALAHDLATGPTAAYGLIKRAFNHVMLEPLSRTMDYEAYLQEFAGRTADHREGVLAFTQKRSPKFLGR